MRILIIGLGRMGYSLAEQLESEGHRVYGIDTNKENVERASIKLDIMCVHGSGCSLSTLRELDIEGADLVIAASGSDEINIVSCLVARELGIKRCIARIESEELANNLREMPPSALGIDEFVNPREETVRRMADIVRTPGTTMTAEFDEGKFQLRGLRVEKDSQLTSRPLVELQALFVEHFLVPAVQRGDTLIIPRGDFTIKTGDVVYVLLKTNTFQNFLSLFEFANTKTRRVFIYGGSQLGIELVHTLEKTIPEVILLEEDWDKRQQASSQISKSAIINGSPQDMTLMQDLKISNADFFVGVSDSEELNFSSALLAKRMGSKYGVMLTDHPDHVELFDTLPIDAVVSPATLSVGAILKAARSGAVLSMFNIAGGRGEALELIAQPNSKNIGKALKDISFPEGALVAAIANNEGFHIASGNTVIEAGSSIILISKKKNIKQAIELFE
ncbi:Trk system potassium transporter TrkA [Methanocorpusculum sp.]